MSPLFLRIALAMCFFAWSCPSPAQAVYVERLRIHGSNTLDENLVPVLARSWLQSIGYSNIRQLESNPRVTEIHAIRDGMPLIVEIDKSGSAAGFQDLVAGQAELAMMARAPNAIEKDDAWQLGDLESPEQEFIVALDGLAVLVNAGNPVNHISIHQLRGVLSGQINNWKQLGGHDLPIQLKLPAARSGTAEWLRQRVMGTDRLSRPAQTFATLAQVARSVANDQGALAVVDLGTRIPPSSRTLAVSDGGIAVLPTRLNVISEDYPLTRRYRLYGGQMMSALGRSFALYSISRPAQSALEQAGFFSMMLRPVAQMATRDLQAYDDSFANAARLPVSLRFNMASLTTFFDSRSSHDLDRLLAFMQLPANRNRQLLVVAFANSDAGNRLAPTMISNDRADLVAGLLTSRGIMVRRSIGLGSTRPLLAADNPHAGRFNERVEVWMQ